MLHPGYWVRPVAGSMLMICALIIWVQVKGQQSAKASDAPVHVLIDTSLEGARKTGKYFGSVQKKADEFNAKVEKHVRKSLNKLLKQERKMQRHIMKTDSFLARTLFTYSIDSLTAFRSLLQQKRGFVNKIPGGKYFARLDTLAQSLSFLAKHESFTEYGKELQKKWGSAMDGIKDMESNLDHIRHLQDFLSARKETLKSKLKDYPQLLRGIKNMSKEAYYLGERVNELRTVFNDPSKIESAVISVLREMPAFKEFMRQHAQLAGLFPMSNIAGGGSQAGMPVVNGIPSRAAVQQAIQASAPGMGANLNSFIEQRTGQAQSALQQFKNELNEAGGMGDKEMPDFKPNSQRVKSFKKRLEYGFDFQFTRSNYMLPSTGDVSLLLGYKLNDKSSVGVAGVYKFGMGHGWNDIRFSNIGVGLRSYMNWKIKGSFYVQGGGEWNYNAGFRSIEQLRNSRLWQESVVAGIVKKYRVSKKMKGNVQVLFDFLHKQHIPNTQPILFRFGCNF